MDRRNALGVMATFAIAGASSSYAQDDQHVSELMDQSIQALAIRDLLLIQRGVFSFYLTLLEKGRPEDFDRSRETINQLDNFIGHVPEGDYLFELSQNEARQVYEMFLKDRNFLIKFLEEMGIISGSTAMQTVELSYLTMFSFYGAAGIRNNTFNELSQSRWCCWPICF